MDLHDDALDVAAESGQQRAARFRELEAECRAKADSYRRQAEACEKGNAGERLVAGLLDTLDGAGWVVLNDRYKAVDSQANLDHLVVGPHGVSVVDAKNWSGGLLALDERGMRFGRWRKDDELRAGGDALRAVQECVILVDRTAPVQTVLAFTQSVGLEQPVEHQGVVLLQAEQLLRWLTDQPRVLTPQQVHRLASSLDAALPPRTGSRRPLTAEAAAQRGRARGRDAGRSRATRAPRRPVAPSVVPGRPRRRRELDRLIQLFVLVLFVAWVLPALL